MSFDALNALVNGCPHSAAKIRREIDTHDIVILTLHVGSHKGKGDGHVVHAVSYSDPIDKIIRFLFIDTLNAMRDSHRAYFEGKFRSAGIIKPEEMMINACFDQVELECAALSFYVAVALSRWLAEDSSHRSASILPHFHGRCDPSAVRAWLFRSVVEVTVEDVHQPQ